MSKVSPCWGSAFQASFQGWWVGARNARLLDSNAWVVTVGDEEHGSGLGDFFRVGGKPHDPALPYNTLPYPAIPYPTLPCPTLPCPEQRSRQAFRGGGLVHATPDC